MCRWCHRPLNARKTAMAGLPMHVAWPIRARWAAHGNRQCETMRVHVALIGWRPTSAVAWRGMAKRMALDDYRGKRAFAVTPEPVGRARKRSGTRPIFVVQLHHASHRHYDFRLQVGDTLKSWAVPKGPSFDPAVKRMAVEVEDHPIDYAGFEGDIPKGHYGGGHVAVFDRGTWTTDLDVDAQLAKGHLRFELHGEKLKGGWHLVRSGKPARQPQWLLFKQDDAWAGPGEADDLLDDVAPAPVEDAKRARRPGAKTAPTPPAPIAKRTRSASRAKVDWHAEAMAL